MIWFIPNLSICYQQSIYGIEYNHGFQNHRTSLTKIRSSILETSENLIGKGNSNHFNAFYSFPIFRNECQPSPLNLGFNIGYKQTSAEVFGYSKDQILLNNELITGDIKQSIKIDYTSFVIGTYLTLFESSITFMTFGIEGHFFANNSYYQKEVITSPKNEGAFQDNQSRSRNIQTGKIPDINSIIYICYAKIHFDIPLNEEKNYYISPTLFLEFQINEISKSSGWFSTSYGIGLSFKYHFKKPLNFNFDNILTPS
ncbi:MAG: hypothetical protein KIT33_00810 [Candidatus Kapabacteria bacterium]|nr:hypothetical protein [Ignavibacteriota bacterium]MCW5883487.1 hypothetical protein [Candidatus Kapabacteria bacterium]